MTVKPWAKAIAAMPGRPTPSPTTAAVPAPMNINAKVPMNSARSLGAIRLGIVDSRDEIDRLARSDRAKEQYVGWGGRRRGERRPAKRAGLLRGDRLRFEIDAQRFRDARAICGIGLVAVDDLPLDDLDRYALHRRLVVMEELVLLVGRHQPEEIPRLPVIIIAVAVIVAIGIARDFQRRFVEALVLHGAVERVRLVIGIRIWVACEPHGTIGVVSVHGAARLVDWKLIRVDAYSVAVRIGVGEDARLQHLVRRMADTGHNVCGRERGLLDFGEIIHRIAVELEHADLDQRIVLVRPYFGKVERVVPVLADIAFRHDLHGEFPFREIALLDRFEQIALMGLAVVCDPLAGFGVGPVPDALHGLEVEFYPVPLVVGVDERVSMRAEAVDVAIALRQAAVRHQNGDLVQALWRQ